MDFDCKEQPGFHVQFDDVTVSVPEGKARKNILRGISGGAKPGEILGIMGPSGAGKTTLLNLISGRLELANAKIESGKVTINGKALTKRLKRRIGYVLQQDILFPQLTVHQSLDFVGQLRLPRHLSKDDKRKRVNKLISNLGIEKCQHTTIGGGLFDTGISGGEKKRVSVGMEMITDPPLLFMDEPTTGLDSSSAASLITLLKELAVSQKKTIICTLHQPSSQIFYTFDKLLLLCEGRVAYFGPTKDVVNYFAKLGLPCHPNWNPADDLIEKLKSGREAEEKICDAFQESRSSEESSLSSSPLVGDRDLSSEEGFSSESSDSTPVQLEICEKDVPKWEATFATQVRVLTQRTFLQSKGAILDKWNIVQTLLGALVVALLWFQLPYKEESIVDRNGMIFFTSTYWMFTSIFQTLLAFPEERPVISKERESGMYRLSSYYVSKCLSELPVVIVQPMFFWTAVYWPCGLQYSAAFVSSSAIILLEAIISQSVGLLIGALITDLKQALVTAIIVALSVFLAGGYLVQELPSWFSWFQYFSLAVYPYISLLHIEYTGSKPFRCQTAGSQFLSCLHFNGTTVTGEEVLKSLNLRFQVWECVVAMLAQLVILRTLCYFAMRRMSKLKG